MLPNDSAQARRPRAVGYGTEMSWRRCLERRVRLPSVPPSGSEHHPAPHDANKQKPQTTEQG
jgi:hypothetical protein